MKKRYILSLLMILAFIAKSNQSHAQIPGVNFYYAGDSTYNSSCSLPDTTELMIYGGAVGYAMGDSVLLNISFGDGTDTTFYSPIYPNAYFAVYPLTHIYTLPGNYAVQFIVTGSDGSSDTLVDNSVLVAASCGDISGVVYLDSNNDCVFNVGETPVQYAWVTAQYGGAVIRSTMSDANGNYYLSVPSGFNYTVTIAYTGMTIACPSLGYYTVNTLPSNNNDFGLVCNAQFDLSGHIYGQGYRVNNTSSFYISGWNNLISCAPPTATLTITLDPNVTFVTSTVPPTNVNGQVIEYNVGQLNGIYLQPYIWMTVQTNSSVNIGDTLCMTLQVDPVTGDANPADNTIIECFPVRNSCDPNEKFEMHAGAGTASIAPGTGLDYTIMFQNVGNDVAYDISIVDTLDSDLDLSTLKIQGFSHQPKVRIINSNILKFEFKNINLAAASVNEPLSHGFVSYKISPKANLVDGTSIDNRAHIYFDFNAAIITNTVTDVIDMTLGVNDHESLETISIYPNPAHEIFTIIQDQNTTSGLVIYDATGKMVINDQVTGTQKISTKNLRSGLYLIQIESAGKRRTGKLLVN